MGLFDKRKKGDDFDSPVENIDLSAPAADPAPQNLAQNLAQNQAQDQAQARPAQASIVEEKHMQADEPTDEDDFDPPAYGIDDAIQLMRALPGDNVELVVQVVKRTLESTKVKVKTIIDDASRKQADIEGRIAVLKTEIAEYEQEIKTRKEEIEKLDADHKETSMVKDRLQLAEKLTTDRPAAKQAPSKTPPGTPAPSTTSQPQRSKPGGTLPPTGSGGGTALRQTTAKGTTIVSKK